MKKENIKRKKTAQAPLEISNFNKRRRKNKSLTGQEVQDEIFRKMSVARKFKLASELALFCLKLNSLHGTNRPRKTSY